MPNSFKSLDNKFISFPNMLEIDISGCHQLDAHRTISFLSRAFPSLAILRASHCSQFRLQDLNFLINSCPTLHEVDFSLGFDAGDFPWSGHGRENVLIIAADVVDNRCVAQLSKLTLEGHNDLNDRHFSEISNLTEMLSYLNITSCSGLSDMAIAAFLRKCLSIHSLLLCYTSFGKESVKVLCSDDCQNPISCPTIASRLQCLHLDGCKGVDEFAMSHLLSHMTMIKEVSLRGTSLTDEAISNFTVSSLERLDVSDTKVSMVGLRPLIRRNHNLRCLKATGCTNLHQELTTNSAFSPLLCELIDNCTHLEEVAFGWGFSLFSVLIEEMLVFSTVRELTLGLGASPGLQFLHCLPILCPLIESLVLRFQVTSDDVIRNLLASLKHLQVLELRCCLGDLTIHCFEVPQNLMLTALRLEWVCKWMTNDHLALLTSTFCSLTELSLSGCQLLDSYSQDIISAGWPGLTVLHLEECGILSKSGVSSLLSCKGLEDLLLRHNGGGIPKTFITDAASELLQLRILALDLCDACDGGFDSPSRTFLRTVKMSRCRKQKLSLGLKAEIVKPVHKETIILQWNAAKLSEAQGNPKTQIIRPTRGKRVTTFSCQDNKGNFSTCVATCPSKCRDQCIASCPDCRTLCSRGGNLDCIHEFLAWGAYRLQRDSAGFSISSVIAGLKETYTETMKRPDVNAIVLTVESYVDLVVNPRRGDQVVRVVVYAEDAAAEEARTAGANVVGGDELIEEIQTGGEKLNFDKRIATPIHMLRHPKVSTMATVSWTLLFLLFLAAAKLSEAQGKPKTQIIRPAGGRSITISCEAITGISTCVATCPSKCRDKCIVSCPDCKTSCCK
ncbi:BTB/POZ domain-containing protein FBL11 isoform X3 [Carex littledalei]|uniref:BTB/POZ domain-containing protein FBL11 isoform X3 n=1 Tax=Carex littledalei TaxID=544730 RepID=A0A833RK56_9POAL|nr:BTB/POZ domain-containing protein FBL11 isoform X3 [Carex littledalei]